MAQLKSNLKKGVSVFRDKDSLIEYAKKIPQHEEGKDMKQAILITKCFTDLHSCAKLLDKFCKYEWVGETQLNILRSQTSGDSNFLSLSFAKDMEDHMEEIEKNKVSIYFGKKAYYFVAEFREFEVFKRMVDEIYNYCDLIVDNDFGNYYEKNEFLKKNNYKEFIAQ